MAHDVRSIGNGTDSGLATGARIAARRASGVILCAGLASCLVLSAASGVAHAEGRVAAPDAVRASASYAAHTASAMKVVRGAPAPAVAPAAEAVAPAAPVAPTGAVAPAPAAAPPAEPAAPATAPAPAAPAKGPESAAPATRVASASPTTDSRLLEHGSFTRRAQHALEQGMPEAAAELAARGVAANPEDARAWLVLGAAQTQLGNHLAAREAHGNCVLRASGAVAEKCSAELKRETARDAPKVASKP